MTQDINTILVEVKRKKRLQLLDTTNWECKKQSSFQR